MTQRFQRWLWISGWAIPPDWLRAQAALAIPEVEHDVVIPAPCWEKALENRAYTAVAGYSLGALLLLADGGERLWPTAAAGSPAELRSASLPVLLVAPIFGFCAEDARGGVTRRSQLIHLKRWLQRDPESALADFYRRAALPLRPLPLPYAMEELLWGLDALARKAAPFSLPAGCRAWIGDRDPLLDARVISAAVSSVNVVAGAGHSPEPLFEAARAAMFPLDDHRKMVTDPRSNFSRSFLSR